MPVHRLRQWGSSHHGVDQRRPICGQGTVLPSWLGSCAVCTVLTGGTSLVEGAYELSNARVIVNDLLTLVGYAHLWGDCAAP